MSNQDLDIILNKLNAQRQRLRDRIERSRKELDNIESHIKAVQKETTERLLQDERVDNALIEQTFQHRDDGPQKSV
ncbi:MAG TPA: hypothetical protein V6D22_08290 [Candidatus Obscuribacterales bacterium]